jgi:hypothetical protein
MHAEEVRHIEPQRRFTVELIDRGPMGNRPAETLEDALNNPAHHNHGLEGIYAIESKTVLVWRTSI